MAAVREVAERVRPDVALANHLVMGPVILARALGGTGVPYAVKIHGSALEYTVKPHPRFMPSAREGLAGARGVLVGSRHTGESLWAAMDDPGAAGPHAARAARRGRRRFAPREPRRGRRAGLEGLRDRLAAAGAPDAPAPTRRRRLLLRPRDGRGGRGARRRRPGATGSWCSSAS